MTMRFGGNAFGAVHRIALYKTGALKAKLIVSAEVHHPGNTPCTDYITAIVDKIIDDRGYEAEFAPLLKRRVQIRRISSYEEPKDSDAFETTIEIEFALPDDGGLIREDGVYVVPVTWTMYSTIHVEADSLEDAVRRAEEARSDLPLGDAEYLEDSYQLCDLGEAEEMFSYEDHSVPFRGVFLRRDGSIGKALPE